MGRCIACLFAGQVSTSWFATTNAETVFLMVQATYDDDSTDQVAASSEQEVVLTEEPTFDALASANMEATLPHHPLLAGDSFTVDVVANTDSQVARARCPCQTYGFSLRHSLL